MKKKIKEEEAKKLELQATTQSWEDASQRMTKRSKVIERIRENF